MNRGCWVKDPKGKKVAAVRCEDGKLRRVDIDGKATDAVVDETPAGKKPKPVKE